jgi:hypothetical protein
MNKSVKVVSTTVIAGNIKINNTGNKENSDRADKAVQ